MHASETVPARFTYEAFVLTPMYETHELVHGVPRELPGSARASYIAGQVVFRPERYNRSVRAGYVLFGTYCRCHPADPHHLRRPKVLFLRRGRLADERIPTGDLMIPPDLTVEVPAPTELAVDLEVKTDEYLRCGVGLVWLVFPETRTVRIHRADGTVSLLHECDTISGETVLEGFTCPVADFFPPGT